MVEHEMDNADERRRMARQSKFHNYRDNVHILAGDQRHVLNMTYDLLAQVILQTTKNTKGLHTWLDRLKDERKDTENKSNQRNSPQYTLLNDLIAALEDTVSSILEEQGVSMDEEQQSSPVVEPRQQSLHDSSSDSANSPLFDDADAADPGEIHIKQELHDDETWLNALPTPQSPARVQKKDRREWEARSEMGPKRAGGGEDEETSVMFSKRSRMDEEEPTSSLEPYRNRKTKLLGRARRCATVQNYGESDDDYAYDRAARDEDDREPGHFGCFKCGQLFDTKKAQMQHSFTAHNTVPVVRFSRAATVGPAADQQAWTKNGSGDFQCAYCPRSFPSKRGIDSHGKVHQGVQCAVCHKFMKKEKLANHMVEKHKGTGKEAAHVSTPDTGAAAARKAQSTTPAARNARAGTAQPVTPATPAARKARCAQLSAAGFACDVCERVFDTEKGMRIHMTGAHTGDPRAEASSHRKDYFACPVEGCKVERNVMGLIYDHLRKDHEKKAHK
ncbi:hypothetical protein PRIPAC_76323 [Pristionchus pacificus]|uniref:Uncharacterized protein n=1 Tax=Pristionchus pacificus TaxID=54126 RepID=A0A2A6C623_PRIPA|nr:hypothetical protein PRIPAC_76323 [Pristionchus pacificus]|eukprot:PDM73471.1 hypothetical protein PRIPAC_40827 [Pristionchus pacificus]